MMVLFEAQGRSEPILIFVLTTSCSPGLVKWALAGSVMRNKLDLYYAAKKRIEEGSIIDHNSQLRSIYDTRTTIKALTDLSTT